MTDHVPFSSWKNRHILTSLKVGSKCLSFRTPEPSWLGEVALSLRDQHSLMAERTTPAIIRTLEEVNARWADPSSAERQEADALLAAVTGYPIAVIGPALDHLFAGLR